MQAQHNAQISGEEELSQVAQKCLDSPDTHLFVVGPPRSGKSTRLPVLLSALSGKKVICVQPDDRVAQCHADWIQSNGADAFGDKTVRVGYHKDEEDMKPFSVPDYDVTYISSRWLYRMVVGAGFNESQRFSDKGDRFVKEGQHLEVLARHRRSKLGKSIGYVLLDEMHAQSVVQEIGYMAIHAAISGLAEAPIGFFAGTKVIYTTAYPENYTFLDCFDLSEKEIEKRLIKIDRGLAPAAGYQVLERFIPEDSQGSPDDDYHRMAVQKAQEILKSNKEARILLLMDTMYSSRNIARQNRNLQKAVKVLDLEAHDGWNAISEHSKGPIVILATPDFASRIPAQGITDVICPFVFVRPVLSKKLHKEIFLEIYLVKWEFAWAKSHLDPSLETSTIHYMCKASVHSTRKDVCGARFRAADFVDIMLAMVRLCPEHALGARTPTRFLIPLNTAERAFRHLTIIPPIIQEGINSTEALTQWVMPAKLFAQIMVMLMDRCGLDRRHAYFLGSLRQRMEDDQIKSDHQRLILTVGVCMVVFDDSPILRMKRRPIPETEAVAKEFSHLLDLFHFGQQDESTSDSWMNAVVWMDIKRRAVAAGSDMAKFAREHCKSKQVLVDQVPLLAAESKLRFLARMVGLDEISQKGLCDGSFLKHVEEFHNADVLDRARAAITVWQSYFYAFQFNLVYVTVEKEAVKVIDIGSATEVDYDGNHVVVDLFEQSRVAARYGRDGFYATFRTRTYFGYRTMAVIPVDILCNIVEYSGGNNGAFRLRYLLRLD
ncbi:hypothetical protein FHL15_011388 [Xylaria flabelliformis]|uniref:Uncharacterized protein n=1 Tax=Xylaria flabelliformis TaxID=2512241 RepID=A0A553HIE1_9PEZI|nr:hypothetical protein FHL15_011388 [Xylaria flabelliformis]